MLQCLFTIMAGLLALPGPGLPSHFPVFEGEQWLYTPGHFHGEVFRIIANGCKSAYSREYP